MGGEGGPIEGFVVIDWRDMALAFSNPAQKTNQNRI